MIPSHLFDPHHDGSPRYVLDQAPSLGDTVRVRVWVPHDPRPGACAPDGVWLRSVRDGEPFLVRATASSAVGAGTWWEAGLLVSNPVTSYRFLLRYGDSYRWLNGAGVHDRDVTDAGDFRVSTDHRPTGRSRPTGTTQSCTADQRCRSSGSAALSTGSASTSTT